MDIENIENLQPSLNIGCIGHVSHGKSSIVKAFTGISTGKYDTEVLKNMTIKLGYANAKIWYCGFCKRHFSTASHMMNVLCDVCDSDECELKRHISFVDCFDPSTKVLMYDGSIECVSALKVGDFLMGPEGGKRRILNLSTGSKDLYEIEYLTNYFICTGGHPLVLRMDTPIEQFKINDSYIVKKYYADNETLYSKTHSFENLDDAVRFYNLNNTALIFEMTVEAFIMLPPNLKNRIRLFHSNGLEFDHDIPSISMDGASDEEIGWLIGLSIGETLANVAMNDEVIEKVKEISEKIGYHANLLMKLALDKHIDLKFQKKTVREAIIAGLIDSNGQYNGQFEIQSFKEMDEIIWLIRSIGFTCYSEVDKIIFNGKASRLPIVSLKKRGKDTLLLQPFTVNKKGIGNYIGFELDGDQRFLLSDFIVAHNCPGHEILMSTMLNGATIMDAALIIVAADQPCPQPQTQEHLIALDMLGIDQHIIIQNKIDLVSIEQATHNFDEIKSFVKLSKACEAPVIPISAHQKLNMDILCEYISQIPIPLKDHSLPPLMMIVRSFDINKPGTLIKNLQGGVMGGSLLTGVLKMNQAIEIRPGIVVKNKNGYSCVPITTEIISLASENNFLTKAHPGGLIAVGSDIDPYCTKGDRLVGHIIGLRGSMPSVYVKIEMSYVLMVKNKMMKNELLRLNIGSLTVDAKVLALKEDLVLLDLSKPACIIPKSKIAVSRKDKTSGWRLIGIGVLCHGTAIL